MNSLSHSAQGVDYWPLSCGPRVVEVQDHQGRSDDAADASGVQADVAQCVERHLQEGIASLTDGAQAVMGLVELLLYAGQRAVPGFLERHGDGVGLAFVAQV